MILIMLVKVSTDQLNYKLGSHLPRVNQVDCEFESHRPNVRINCESKPHWSCTQINGESGSHWPRVHQ